MITDLKKHFHKNLALAYPVMLSHLGQVMVQVSDSMMVGRVSTEALGGATFANSLFGIFLMMGIGMSFAITPQTAQADGEHNHEKLAQILKHGFLVNVVFGILLSSFLVLGRDALYRLNQPLAVVDLAIPYFKIISLSLIPFMVYQAFRQFAEGLGHTKQAMYITITANVVNIILNYIFIFGKLGMEPMGLYGAGLATLISRILMAVLMVAFVYLNHRFAAYWQNFTFGQFSLDLVKQNLRLGIPMTFQLTFEVTTFGIAAIMVGWLGKIPLAAHNIALNLASITYMISLGISVAATIRVGNQLGRKDYTNMRNAALTCFLMVIMFMSVTAMLFIFGRNLLPQMYVDELEVIDQAAILLIVAGFFQLSDGIQVIGLGALRGMSDVRIPTVITLFAYWIIGLPSGYLFGFVFDLGAMGIWFGLFAGLTLAAILLFIRFNRLSKELLPSPIHAV